MAPITSSISWTTYYTRNRDNDRTIQTLFDNNWTALHRQTLSHLGNPVSLAESIGGSTYGNMMIVPCEPRMQLLQHHGFTCNTNKGFSLVFAQGNLGESSYFKILPRVKATTKVSKVSRASTPRGWVTINGPTLESMIESKDSDESVGLEAAGNVILH